MRPLIIGYGNPLRSDDGVGWHAAQMLRRRDHRIGARVVAAHQLAPEMAEDIAAASLVIFIDARPGEPAGRVRWRRLRGHVESRRSLSHHLSPAALMSCAGLLFRKTPPAFLVTVAARQFEPGEGLSAAVGSVLPALAAEIEQLVERVQAKQ